MSISTSPEDGITFAFSPARALVGVIVIPIIGSTSRSASRAISGPFARIASRPARRPSSPFSSLPVIAETNASPASLGSSGGWLSSFAIRGASFSSALSPTFGSEACPARPATRSLIRKTPFSPTLSV